MILEWTLLFALAAVDGGAPLPLPEPAEPRPDCKPPGYWDAKTKQCKPGCGIPTRWEGGRRVGGCGRHDDSFDELEDSPVPAPKPKKK